ncbi:MAG: hypothetical protein SGJ07_13105 [Rhodospirillaceae bacterium]|nr:hypothetical protein [Rhodospirillaceae bacterium]
MTVSRTIRRAALAGLLLVAGACSSTPALAVDQDDLDITWDDDVIEIELEDDRAFDEAQLVAPDGTVIDAYRIDRDTETLRDDYNSGPSVGVGVGGGSGGVGVGVGIGFPIFSSGGGSSHVTGHESRAHIRVPDMVAYRRDWEDWRLRVHLEGVAGGGRWMEMAAPAPPQ